MRLLLDAHVSGPVIGRALTAAGHDVFAVDQHRALEGIGDDALLALATRDGRLVVTFNVGHFAALAQAWAADGKDHAGIVLIAGYVHDDFGAVIRRLVALLEAPRFWPNVVVYVSPGSA